MSRTSGETDASVETVLEAHGLWKRYRFGERRTAGSYLLEGATRSVGQAGGPSVGAPAREDRGSFWALRDVSFKVRRGEVVGVVGRNGAGKTTLLQLLARITDPTRGSALIRGRPFCLLGVGTGFHPEFTGRENIYLKGAVHGLTPGQIDRRFDEVVAFAGVEEFLDTPLKRYSSGMRSRLGFALATSVDSEVLILDEVFAVGDRHFKQQAREHIRRITSEAGRTVLIVSHLPSALRQLCSRAILLDEGRLILDGEVEDVLERYLGPLARGASPREDGVIRGAAVLDAQGRFDSTIDEGSTLRVEIEIGATDLAAESTVLLEIGRAGKKPLFRYRSRLADCHPRVDSDDLCRSIVSIDSLPLVAGRYSISVGLEHGGALVDRASEIALLEILAVDGSERPLAPVVEASPESGSVSRPSARETGRLITIYSHGKSGTTSVYKSLMSQTERPLIRFHMLNAEKVRDKISRREKRGLKIGRSLRNSRKYSNDLAPLRGAQLITLIRDPIACAVSSFFYKLAGEEHPLIQRGIETNDPTPLLDLFGFSYDSIERQYLSWIDTEIKATLGFDLLSSTFDKQRCAERYELEDHELLVVKIECDDRRVEQAIGQFLSLDDFRLDRLNTASEKPYHGLYSEFRRQLAPPPNLIDRIYSHGSVRHFYTDEEIRRFADRWSPPS